MLRSHLLAVGLASEDHSYTTGLKNCFSAGALAAVGVVGVFSLLRFVGLTRVNIASGIAGWLFNVNARSTLLGLLCFSLAGGVLGLLFKLILRACRWNGVIPGAVLGVAFWFLVSMLIGTFPSLDVFTPRGEASIGPMGVFEGQVTFCSLLLAHTGYGALIGWCLQRATEQQEATG